MTAPRVLVIVAALAATPAAAADPLSTHVVAGDPRASRAIVEHSDFLCPHCAAALAKLVPQVARTPDLKLVLLPWPLTRGCNPTTAIDNGTARCELPIAAECALRQGKYAELALALYAHQAELAASTEVRGAVLELAAGVDLRPRPFARCLESDSARDRVRSLASATTLEGTPTFDVVRDGAPPIRITGDADAAYAAATAP